MYNMNNRIYLKEHENYKRIKEDDIKRFCAYENLNEDYIKSTLRRSRPLLSLWKALKKRLARKNSATEKTVLPAAEKRSIRVLKTVK